MQSIAVLTSGGDAPGMNAAVRAVVRYAINCGMSVYGVDRGYDGLINDRMTLMERHSVSDIIQRGGTILKTARCKELMTEEGQLKAGRVLRERGIEGLVVIGGDGSFRGARALVKTCGINVVGIPATIDNDLNYTDYTIGFDTAVNTALQSINNLRDTMSSHDRVSIIEVMGRNCGDIAVYSGLAGGAEIVLVPEVETDYDTVAKRLNMGQKMGKTSGIIVVAEGVATAEEVKAKLEGKVDANLRTTVLGHIQRGGMPTMADRVLAAKFGVQAVDLLRKGMTNRVVGVRKGDIVDMDIDEALAVEKNFDYKLYNIAGVLSI